MTRQAILYLRISDGREGVAAGVGRQEKECRVIADRLGWDVAEVIIENDTTAYCRKRIRLPNGRVGLRVDRPGFRRVLDLLDTTPDAAFVGYDLDRVARDPRDLEDLIDIVESRKIPTRSATGSLDLSNDAGITMARVMVAMANKSSRDTARRIKLKREEQAANGTFGGGGIRAYGWDSQRREVIAEEALAIQEIAERVLDGWSLKRIAEELERREVPTVRGGAWNARSVRMVVEKPVVAGLRTHHREIVGPACWPAILQREQWEQVCAALADRSVTKGPLVRWLAGVLRCARCDRPLKPWWGAKDVPRYWCATPLGGCGKISINALRAEEAVGRRILGILTDPDSAAVAESPDTVALDAEIAADEAQLKTLAAMWARRELELAEYTEARGIIRTRLEANRRALRATAYQLPARGPEDAAERWPSMEPAERRELALLLFPRGIIVKPPLTKGPFRPERLVVR